MLKWLTYAEGAAWGIDIIATILVTGSGCWTTGTRENSVERINLNGSQARR
jgi:hypothetical protein